jgi:hypothetical protein
MPIKFILPKELTEFNFEKILPDSEIISGKFYEKPKPLLELLKTKKDGIIINVPVLTKGNLSGVQGKAKSRKTFFLILASYMISIQNDCDIAVCDTEQYNYHSAIMLSRIINLNPDINIRFFNLRAYSIDVRLEFIETYIQQFKPDLLFIDNIRDCMININSWEETNKVLTTFIQLCDKYGTHICCTLHENPGKENDKARGAIGTELQNKCETIFKVETDKETGETKVEGLFTRNMDFDDVIFEINNNGIPVIKTSFDPNAARNQDKVYTIF